MNSVYTTGTERLKTLFIVRLALLFFLFFPGRVCLGCDTFKHNWSVVLEKSSKDVSPLMLQQTLDILEPKVQGVSSGTWLFTSPTEEGLSQLNTIYPAVASATAPGCSSSGLWKLDRNASLFSSPPTSSTIPATFTGIMGLEILEAQETVFFWKDLSPFPLSLFRSGFQNRALIRFVAMNALRQPQLLDEFPLAQTVEVDLILPAYSFLGGIWIRRISCFHPPMATPREWLLMPPPQNLEGEMERKGKTDRLYLFPGSASASDTIGPQPEPEKPSIPSSETPLKYEAPLRLN